MDRWGRMRGFLSLQIRRPAAALQSQGVWPGTEVGQLGGRNGDDVREAQLEWSLGSCLGKRSDRITESIGAHDHSRFCADEG